MIAIADYGLGNIRAFGNIYETLGVPYRFARTPQDLVGATKLILPGVGAFDHAMTKLTESGLREALDRMVRVDHIPVLGVCVGMQILANSSEEGTLPGLGWVPGKVKKLRSETPPTPPLPHMGWNTLRQQRHCAMLQDLGSEPRFYFLHSYYLACAHSEDVVATASYALEFPCVIQRNNVYGIQCHPEKSHAAGFAFLQNWGTN